MLAATIKIRSIDYESTFQQIFPAVSEKIMSWNSENMIIRLLQQLDDAALPVLISVIHRIPADTKNEFLIRSLNAYAPELRDKLNKELKKDKWGQYFEIGTIFISQQAEILLNIGQIKVDYPALLNNDQVNNKNKKSFGILSSPAKIVADMTVALVPDTLIERMGLDLFWTEENKARLMELIRSALCKHGIKIELDEIQFMQDQAVLEDVIESKQTLVFTEKMENDIICALADYLRDTVSNSLVLAEQGERRRQDDV